MRLISIVILQEDDGSVLGLRQVSIHVTTTNELMANAFNAGELTRNSVIWIVEDLDAKADSSGQSDKGA